MNDHLFDVSVFVKDKEEGIREVARVEDALEFLYEWPRERRGPIYDTALRASRCAFEGMLMVSTARKAFACFARSAGVLDDVTPRTAILPSDAPATTAVA